MTTRLSAANVVQRSLIEALEREAYTRRANEYLPLSLLICNTGTSFGVAAIRRSNKRWQKKHQTNALNAP